MTATISGAPPAPPAARAAGRVVRSRSFAVWVLLAAIFVFFSATQPRFLTPGNIGIMLTSTAITFFVAVGLTFVLLSGGFDLSLGSIVALSGIALGQFAGVMGLPIAAGILLTLVVGVAIGLLNGILIGRLGLSFLVVTLGSSSLALGTTSLWSSGQTTSLTSPVLEAVAFEAVLGVPIPVWLMVVVYAISAYFLRWTQFGRNVYAVGGSQAAARLSGVRVVTTLVAVYAIAGGLSALAGVLQVARVGAASPLVGGGLLFVAAAAVLLGGTRLGGGVGGVTGTVAGVLFLAVLQNGLAVSGVKSAWQQLVTGAILIAVIALDEAKRRGWIRRLGTRRAR